MTDDLYPPRCRIDLADALDQGFPIMPKKNPFLSVGQALVEMGTAAVKTKLRALTMAQALEEFNRLFPRPSRFYRKRRIRSMRGK